MGSCSFVENFTVKVTLYFHTRFVNFVLKLYFTYIIAGFLQLTQCYGVNVRSF